MKIIDLSPTPQADNSLLKTVSGVQKFVGSALNIKTEEQAQEAVINSLSKVLNNRFALLRNVPLGDLDAPIPIILIGPPGVVVINCSFLKGIFRAKNDVLLEMNNNKAFEPVRPNLITRTLLMTKAVEDFLNSRGFKVPEVHGILHFSDPGTHVDSSHPAVRILLMDGVDRFTSSLLQSRVFHSREEIEAMVAAISTPPAQPVSAEAASADKSASGLRSALSNKISPEEAALTKRLNIFSEKFPLSTRQWVLLGVMAVMEVFILIGFIVLIMVTT